jgi:molybdate transport system permease protein
LGEFGATITFVSDVPGETRTLPIAIYAAMQVPGGESSATWFAIMSILLSLAALMLSNLLGRRMTRGTVNHVL